MKPLFLIPPGELRESGIGDAFDLNLLLPRGLFSMTLAITRVVEQESVEVFLDSSADGAAWDKKPILAFPQKFYCGVSSLVFDASKHADVRFLRARWVLNRWGRGDLLPNFELSLSVGSVSA